MPFLTDFVIKCFMGILTKRKTVTENSLSEASIPLKLAVKGAFDSTKDSLELIEQRITEEVQSEAPQLTEISEYLLALGGKRIRPLLCVLSAKLFKQKIPSSSIIETATGIELIHMATLLHDDIIDESPTRRSATSAYKRYGVAPTLLTGDFLLVKAFGLCAKLDSFIIEETKRACVELTEGEVLEGKIDPENPIQFDEYLNIIAKKTASLFSLATASGAHLTGNNEETVNKLRRYGHFAGIAFQMIDDILDVIADEDLLGKPSGTDLKQQTPSLINILWLESGDKQAREFFKRSTPTIEEAKSQLELIKQSNIIPKSRQIAKHYASKANASLLDLDKNAINPVVRDRLIAIVEYTLERCL